MKLPLLHVAAAAVLFFVPLEAAQTADSADALKERIVAHARSVTGEEYACTRTAKTEQSGGDSTKQLTRVERYDPTKPAEQRWTLVTLDGRAPTAEELKSHAKDAAARPSRFYGRVATYFGGNASASTDARGRTVFRFASLPKDSVLLNNIDLSASCAGEAVVDASGATPFVQQTKFRLTKPTRMKLVAKIESFDASTTFRMMPDGIPVPVEQVSDMNGSMMGKQGRIRTTLTYSDHRRVGGR